MGLYDLAGRKDFILMAGVDLESYDIPHQWSELLYRDTGSTHIAAPRRRLRRQHLRCETFLDEIAQKRAIDPVQFRLELLRNSPRGRKVVETVATMADWGRRREGRALGFAFVELPAVSLPASPKFRSIAAPVRSRCMTSGVRRIAESRFSRTTWSPRSRAASSTASAWRLERITIKDGIVEQTNFHNYPVPRMHNPGNAR